MVRKAAERREVAASRAAKRRAAAADKASAKRRRRSTEETVEDKENDPALANSIQISNTALGALTDVALSQINNFR